jgi:hypothetical protein
MYSFRILRACKSGIQPDCATGAEHRTSSVQHLVLWYMSGTSFFLVNVCALPALLFSSNFRREFTSSPTCDFCEADDNVKDKEHVLFHCTHPQMVSLRRKYAFLFSQTGQDVCFFTPEKQQTPFFFHDLILRYEQASSHPS